MKKLLIGTLLAIFTISCGTVDEVNLVNPGVADAQAVSVADTTLKTAPSGATYKVLTTLKQTWQWDLSENPNVNIVAQVFDVDATTTPSAKIAQLKARGTYTIGYFDTSYEPYRSDAAQLAPYKCGAYAGWPGQFWLDIRQPVVKQVMFARMAAIKARGFDAVEADSVDVVGNTNRCVPKLTVLDNVKFIKALSDEARRIGLAFFLKNSPEMMSQLVGYFDGVIIEECGVYSECGTYRKLALNVPMFQTEYVQSGNVINSSGGVTAAARRLLTKNCPGSNTLSLNLIVKQYDLNSQRAACN